MRISKPTKNKLAEALRIVVVAPDLVISDPDDEHAKSQAARSRALRIGLLENGSRVMFF
jgi:response regulator NasT